MIGPLLAISSLSILVAVVCATISVTGSIPKRGQKILGYSWLALVVLGCALSLIAAAICLAGNVSWQSETGITIGGQTIFLRLDAVSALFLALVSVIGGTGAAYAREYWDDRAHPNSARAGRLCWSGVLISLGLVLLATNGLFFLIAWELFSLCAYFLVTLDRRSVATRRAGWLYLVASHVSVLCLFCLFSILAARTGSWQLGAMNEQTNLAPLFWLVLAGFGIKAGIFPLHVWLPSAHANAPSHVSALLSGVTLKVAIYGIVRFSGWLPAPPGAGWVVAGLGVVSAVLGVAFALGQHDLKRLLAYHSVENIGIILIGVGFGLIAIGQGNLPWGQLAMAGGFLHIWNHGLFKSLLFFSAGSVLHATGAREMSRLGGLWRAMPWTTTLFALGAVAISGLPPLNGFVSEWLIFLGLFEAAITHTAAWAAIPAALLLGITGALALACFVKVCGVVFLGAPRSEAARHPREAGIAMRGAMLSLGFCCIVIGLAPAIFWPSMLHVVNAWHPNWSQSPSVVPLGTLGGINIALAVFALLAAAFLWRKVSLNGNPRAVTWDCGYVAPTARMQYTAGSFAAIINDWFAWILRPIRHETRPDGPFPQRSGFSSHTPETVLENVVEPIGNSMLQVARAARRLQRGRVQGYLLYLLIGIGALALIVSLGGN